MRTSSLDAPGVVLSAVVLSAIGAVFYNVLPLFLGTVQDSRSLSDAAAGTLASAFFLGFTLAAASAYFWIRRMNWRSVTLVFIPIAMGALIAASSIRSLPAMMLAVFFAGAAFSVLYGIGVTVLGDTSQPARWFGLKIAAEAGLGALLLAVFPSTVVTWWGFEGFMLALAVTVLLLAPLLAWLPPRGTKSNSGLPAVPGGNAAAPCRAALRLALAGVLCFLFSTTLVWAQLERLAHEAGFEAVMTGNALSLGLLFAMAGSLLAVALSDRLGSARPLILAGAVILGSLFLLAHADSFPVYRVAVCGFTLALGMGIPYFIHVVAVLDLEGRYVILTVPAVGIGVSLAPAIGGVLSGSGSFLTVLFTGGAATLAAVAAALIALHLGRPPAIDRKWMDGNAGQAHDPRL
ncbi:MAG: MFS transporter [Xanthomonadales bacterium]|nr:MFS transporter [Gammaproteobacteria bacterium]MBT8052300.1 MFS transporter [Gammaproteobacteria bacterium]NNK51524.1 MFS transporter [Xanthomonadales bacterium]